jgi:hypothetical protein
MLRLPQTAFAKPVLLGMKQMIPATHVLALFLTAMSVQVYQSVQNVLKAITPLSLAQHAPNVLAPLLTALTVRVQQSVQNVRRQRGHYLEEIASYVLTLW